MNNVTDTTPNVHNLDPAEIARRLAAPFTPDEIRFKPACVSGSRALAMPYITARAVMDRLDDVLGIDNWRDEYTVLADGNVVCKLSLRINGEWLTKADVGSQSEQEDGGDRMKAGFSDGLKRAAVRWGIGRCLYRLPPVWADYDPKRKQFARPPQLPSQAPEKKATLPATNGTPAPRPNGTAKIGHAGAVKLVELAEKMGATLADEVGKVATQGTPVEDLTSLQARALWKILSTLPDAVLTTNGTPAIPPTAGNGKPRTSSVPF